jgi:transposase InsO family protein
MDNKIGPTQKIISYQERQFEANLFKALCNKYNINKVRTTPYNPQSNEKIERFHRTLQETLRSKGFDHNWLDKLTETLFALRLSPNSKNKKSPLENLFGINYTPNIINRKLLRETKILAPTNKANNK